MSMNWMKDWFWPDVSIRRKAQGAIDEAFWVALALAVFRVIVFVILYMRDPSDGPDPGILLEALLFGGLALGIRLRSRASAVSAFAIYVLESVYGLVRHPAIPLLPLAIAFALFAGVRGTFAYRKLPPKVDNLPSVSDSFKAMKVPPESSPPTPPE
jgi:hypothetical protein